MPVAQEITRVFIGNMDDFPEATREQHASKMGSLGTTRVGPGLPALLLKTTRTKTPHKWEPGWNMGVPANNTRPEQRCIRESQRITRKPA